MVHAVLRAAVLGLAVLSLAACGGAGGDEALVARAGDIEITMADFQEAYNRISAQYRPDLSTLEAKRSFANDLVNKTLLIHEGERMGGITDQNLLDAFAESKENKMIEILLRQEVEAKVEVLGSDVADLWEHRKLEVRASHILFDDPELAETVRARIEAGEVSFADAAREHSLDMRTKRQGGSLGQVQWGQSVSAFQEKAFELEPGELSEVFESDYGYHIVVVESREEKDIGTLQENRPALRAETRRHLEAVRLDEFVQGLMDQRNFEWNDEGFETLARVVREMATVDIDTIPMADRYLPEADAQQAATVLVKWDGGTITISDYVDWLRSQPPANRPVGAMPVNGLKTFVRSGMLNRRLLVDEAVARGHDKNPEVDAADSRMREQALVEIVHGRFIQAADVTEEEAKAIYDSTLTLDPTAFTMPERVDLVILVHEDVNVVREGLRRIRSGEPEDEVIGELSRDFRTRMNGGRTGFVSRGTYAVPLEEVAFSKDRVGKGWSDAVITETGVGAVRVLAHEDPRTATFDEVKQNLISRMAQARGEEAFEEWLQSERATREVEIFDEVLDRIGQPVS